MKRELAPFFWSMAEADRCPIVICNLEHEILYMNPAAKENYAKWGGDGLLGKSLLDCHNAQSGEQIKRVVSWFSENREHNRIYTSHNEKKKRDVYMVALRDEAGTLIGYYEKHEYREAETMRRYDFG